MEINRDFLNQLRTLSPAPTSGDETVVSTQQTSPNYKYLCEVLKGFLDSGLPPGAKCCPVCFHLAKEFKPYGYNQKRENAVCPKCGAQERHRLIWNFLRTDSRIFSKPTRMLHFAPEKGYEVILRETPTVTKYVTVDIEPGKADIAADIQNLPFEDNSFDFIYCSHVLEHIPDDRKALRELYRVLDTGGEALICVPIKGDLKETYEDPTIVSPEERQRHFGSPTHLRFYAMDVVDRISEAGFKVTSYTNYRSNFPDWFAEMCVLSNSKFFIGKK